MRSTVSKAALMAAAAFYIFPMAAQAQTAPQADQGAAVAEPEQDAAPVDDAAASQEITVTGSRVITNGNNAPTPVTVVSPEALAVTKPGRVFESLQDLPVFSGSRGVTSTPSNSQPNAGTSVSALNLRNLGGLRALALFDGRRIPPTTADGYVNLNAIPQLLLQRVDIVTGGASAVYGSDAVSGVVNFITDRKFNGVKMHAQSGISGHGDDFSYDVGMAAGSDLFGGRGHLEVSYQHIFDEGIPHKTARDWAGRNYTVQGNGTTVPYHLQDNVHIAFATFGGLIVCPGASGFRLPCPASTAPGYRGPLIDSTFDQNGVLTPFEIGQTGTAAGLTDATIQIGGDGAYHTWPSLKSKNQLDQAFARFDFDATDDIHFYVQGSATRDYTSGNPTNLRFFGQGVNIGACNAFLAAQYQTAFGCTAANNNINATTQPTFTFNKIFNFLDNPAAPGAIMNSTTNNYFVMTGLDGKLGNFRWEVGYTHSLSKYRLNVTKNMDMRRVNAALDAVVDPASGNVVCRVSLTANAGLYPGCVPINLFGPSAESQAAFDYIFTNVYHETTNKLDDLSGSISGSPFDIWAGPVQVALSGEYRRQTYKLDSSSLPSELQNCVGIRFNCTPGVSPANINQFAARSEVSQKVSEIAGEINIPLLKDQTFFKDLNLNAAGRFTHYANDPNDPAFTTSSFNAVTWKVGATWAISDLLTLRAGRSRDIRAPNLYDLYSPIAINRSSFTFDYLLNANLNVPIQSGGNPDLKPEVANTLTLGAVLRPATGLSFSVDYYNIKITDALASIAGTSQAVQQGCYASNGASPLCALLVRGGANPAAAGSGPLTLVYSRPVNIAEQSAEGVDFEANYRTNLFGRTFALRGLVTYQPRLIYSQPPLPTNNQAGISYNNTYGLLPTPKTKVAVFVHLEPADGFSLDISERWRSKLRLAPKELAGGGTSAVVGDIPAVAYTNVTATFAVPGEWGRYEFFFNVQNLFDKDPPPAGSAQVNQFQPGLPPNGYVVGDDVVGRYFTAGVRVKF